MDHFTDQRLHLPVPFQVWLILNGTLEIAKDMGQAFLMVDGIGIEGFVMVVNRGAAGSFQRDIPDTGMAFGMAYLV